MADRFKPGQPGKLDFNYRFDHTVTDGTSSKHTDDSTTVRDVRLRKLLGLLSTDVQELATSLLKDLDNEQKQNNDLKSNPQEINILMKENAALKLENENLKIKATSSPRNDADTVIKALNKKLEELEKRANHEKRAREEADKKHQEEKKSNKEALEKSQDDLYCMQQTINKQQNKINALEKDWKAKEALRKKDQQRKIDSLELQLKKTKQELKYAKDELEEVKTRLSKSMGDRLTDNNPQIADLSDRNRPTKLAEVFQEIYDNEWTDAFETIDNGDEKSTTSVLLNILMETKAYCDRKADDQMKQIQDALTQEAQSEQQACSSIPANVNKQLKDCRKSIGEMSGKQMYKMYQEVLLYSSTSTAKKAKKIPEFVESCFKVCWLMAIQDPPVVFGPNTYTGNVFDTDLYRAYTKSGKTVDYVVWPALLLHANGPVLCKGVAQGLDDTAHRSKSLPPSDRRKEQPSEEKALHMEDLDISHQDPYDKFNTQVYNTSKSYKSDGRGLDRSTTVERTDVRENFTDHYNFSSSTYRQQDTPNVHRNVRHDFGSYGSPENEWKRFDNDFSNRKYDSNTHYQQEVLYNSTTSKRYGSNDLKSHNAQYKSDNHSYKQHIPSDQQQQARKAHTSQKHSYNSKSQYSKTVWRY